MEGNHAYNKLHLAMQAVLKYQPENPLRFLTTYFDPVATQPMRIILLGAPGAGKGTVAKHLVGKYGVEHISPGNLLRDEINRNTPRAAQIKEYVSKGQLVPDDIIISLITNYVSNLQNPDWLLDGFPRSPAQAAAMRQNPVLFPTHIIELAVDQVEVTRRMSGRRFDPITGNTYHIEFDPPPQDIASRCVQREDDREDVIRSRFAIYEQNKLDILRVFTKSVKTIDCRGLSIDGVASEVDAVLRLPSTIHPSIIAAMPQ